MTNSQASAPVNPNYKRFSWSEFQASLPIPLEMMVQVVAGIASADMSDEDSQKLAAMLSGQPRIAFELGEGPEKVSIEILADGHP